MSAITYTGDLVLTSCWCGIHLAIPQSLEAEARRTGKGIYCPVGHSFIYRGSENEQLRKQVEDLKARLTHARDDADFQRRQADQARRQAAAQKGQRTKERKRAAAGVCPLCHRHFEALERHMHSKHPSAVADVEREPA
ncbi:MAG TPA: hypothetical protein VF821_16925 [Lentzea sp.]